MTNKKEQLAIRKALLQERMAAQRLLLKPKVGAVINTGNRFVGLFTRSSSSHGHSRANVVVTVLALAIAALGKNHSGWLGVGARYLILHYPGLLRKFSKK